VQSDKSCVCLQTFSTPPFGKPARIFVCLSADQGLDPLLKRVFTMGENRLLQTTMSLVEQSGETRDSRPFDRVEKSLAALQIFIGIGAVPAGIGLILDPTGGNLSMPLSMLDHSPFEDFLIPGLVLMTVNGFGSLIGALLTLRRHRSAGDVAFGLGVFLMAWIFLQVYWIRMLHWLHPLYFGLGLLETILGLTLRRRSV
jgi:hypothetical protein